MMIVSGSEDFAAPGPQPASLIEAIEKLGEEMAKTGKLVSFGIHWPTGKARSRFG
jgi:hypothetical protein